MSLKIGIEIPYTVMDQRAAIIEMSRAAEDLGYETMWCSEVYTFDAFTTLTQIACATETIKVGTNIAQIYARTPALLATTAASLDQLSGGRFVLGLGASGPQVIEGWHGVPYDKPVQRTRETIDIVRTILSGQRLIYDGQVFQMQKGLKLINPVLRPDLPIYVAALGPKNVEMTAEIADGWLPYPYSTAKATEVFGPALAAGAAKRPAGLGPLTVAPFAPVYAGDVTTGMDAARGILGWYIGGMGSKEKNFYNQLAQRYGYVEEAQRVQDLFLSGDKAGAIAATPDGFVDECSIIGDEARIRDRLAAFEATGASELVVSFLTGDAAEGLRMMETLAKANA